MIKNTKIRIERIRNKEVQQLQNLAITTFRESHGHSAAHADIAEYIANKFKTTVLEAELSNQENHFYFIIVDEKRVGYSKIILNMSYNDKTPKNSAKLERLYVLEKFHGAAIGKALMDFNMELARRTNQSGVWLYVWTENHRAIDFYKKYGFKKNRRNRFPDFAKSFQSKLDIVHGTNLN